MVKGARVRHLKIAGKTARKQAFVGKNTDKTGR